MKEEKMQNLERAREFSRNNLQELIKVVNCIDDDFHWNAYLRAKDVINFSRCADLAVSDILAVIEQELASLQNASQNYEMECLRFRQEAWTLAINRFSSELKASREKWMDLYNEAKTKLHDTRELTELKLRSTRVRLERLRLEGIKRIFEAKTDCFFTEERVNSESNDLRGENADLRKASRRHTAQIIQLRSYLQGLKDKLRSENVSHQQDLAKIDRRNYLFRDGILNKKNKIRLLETTKTQQLTELQKAHSQEISSFLQYLCTVNDFVFKEILRLGKVPDFLRIAYTEHKTGMKDLAVTSMSGFVNPIRPELLFLWDETACALDKYRSLLLKHSDLSGDLEGIVPSEVKEDC